MRELERAKRMAAMYRAGKTLSEIGEAYAITRERVRQIIATIGPTYGGRYKRRDQRMQKALTLARAGKSKAQIGEKLGISWNCVDTYLCRFRRDGSLPPHFKVPRG